MSAQMLLADQTLLCVEYLVTHDLTHWKYSHVQCLDMVLVPPRSDIGSRFLWNRRGKGDADDARNCVVSTMFPLPSVGVGRGTIPFQGRNFVLVLALV